ncbi:MFS transporter [Chloroflexota bacterium]
MPKKKIFYGWWMIIVCDIIAIYSGGVWYYGFGAFLKPICDEFGWSRAAVSAGFSFARLESAGTGIPAGYLSDKFGPRRVMLIGIIITGIGFLLFSRVNALWNFYAVFILTALGYGFGFFVPMATVVANWFNKKIGKAMGLFQAGYAGCGLIPPILILLINNYGWKTTLVIIGITMWAICLPMTLLIKHRPEQYGYLPDGEEPQQAALQEKSFSQPQGEASSTSITAYEAEEFTLAKTVREPSFWLITSAFGVSSFAYSTLVVHEIPYLISIGISAEVAALGITCITFSSLLGRIGFGWLGDVFKKRYLMAVCFAIQLAGLLAFAVANAVWLLFISLLVFGPGYGGAMPLRVAMQRDYFGRKSFGVTQGIMLFAVSIPSALGPFFAGWVFDVTQSYRPAFLASTLVYILAIALVMIAKPPKRRPAYSSPASS